MTVEEIKAFVERVSYHGMTFRVESSLLHREFAGVEAPYICVFVIDHETVDSETLKPTTVMTRVKMLPSMFEREADLHEWVWREVLRRWHHEAGEFFKVDGKTPYHPHRKATTP